MDNEAKADDANGLYTYAYNAVNSCFCSVLTTQV